MNRPRQNKDLEVLCQVLRQLNRFSDRLWRQKKDLQGSSLTPSARSNYDRLIIAKYPTEDKDFEDIESNASKLGKIELGQFYMPPLEGNKDFIPLLWVECDFKTSPPKAEFRVGMYRFLSGGKPQCLGFRFEMHNTSSNHNYYHVQVTPRPHPEVDCDYADWIPDEIPCVLLPAKNAVSLVLCMLISFYGRRISEQMISQMNIDKKYKEPLAFLSPASCS